MYNNQNLSKLTVLISTVPERKIFLSRILDFLKDYNCNILVIGPIKNFKKKKNTKKLKYIFYDKKKRAIFKWLALEKHVKTKYVINLADDDFVLPSYLNNSIQFLEKNSVFCCVESFALRFNEQRKKINFNEYFISHHKKLLYSKHERIELFHGNLIRNIFKKKTYFKILNLMISKMNTHPQWDDYFFHFIACSLNEKIYYLPEFGHLRSENFRTKNITRYIEKDRKKIDILNDKKNINFLCKLYSLNNKISKKKSFKIISKLIKNIELKHFKRSKTDILLSILTNRLFFFKINSFYVLKNFFYYPIVNLSKISEIYQILKYCKKSTK